MATGRRCSRCEELCCAYASAAREHVLAMQEQEAHGTADALWIRLLGIRVEALGAERAAARVKITTHLKLSHSGELLTTSLAAGSR